jgi:hypothetical protein
MSDRSHMQAGRIRTCKRDRPDVGAIAALLILHAGLQPEVFLKSSDITLQSFCRCRELVIHAYHPKYGKRTGKLGLSIPVISD